MPYEDARIALRDVVLKDVDFKVSFWSEGAGKGKIQTLEGKGFFGRRSGTLDFTDTKSGNSFGIPFADITDISPRYHDHWPSGKILPRQHLKETDSYAPIIAALNSSFEQTMPTTGFPNYSAFQKALDQAADPTLQLVKRAVREQNIEVAIYSPRDVRTQVSESGLRNAHQTGRSEGDMEPGHLDRRNIVESSYLGIDQNDYAKWPAVQKPKYGMIRAPASLSKQAHINHRQYGDDSYVLDISKVSDRLTFTLGDSLDRSPAIARNAVTSGFERGSWEQSFIPWRYRELMVPETTIGWQATENLAIPTTTPGSMMRSFLSEHHAQSLLPYQKEFATNSSSYVEAQIFGELTLDQVKAFEFSREPPSGDFLKALQKRNIEIRDARTWPPKIWNAKAP